MKGCQHRHNCTIVVVAIEAGRRDLIPSQRVVQRAFADFFRIEKRRIGNIGYYPSVLRTLPGDAVKLALGNLQLALL